MLRDKDQPPALDAPAAQGRQIIHAQNVEIVIIGDLDTDVPALDLPDGNLFRATGRDADDAIPSAHELIALPGHWNADGRGRLAIDRGHGRATIHQELHVRAIHLCIDPEMPVDSHWNPGFAALLHWRSHRLSFQALRDPAQIVAER